MADRGPDYDALLERGRELYYLIKDQMPCVDILADRHEPGWHYWWGDKHDIYLALALLDLHLAQRVRELATAIICPACRHMREANIGDPCSYYGVVLPDSSTRLLSVAPGG